MTPLLRLLALSACCAAAQDHIPISGTVVDSRNGAPLAGVRVAIGPMEHRDVDLATTTTGADGAFAFSVPPADYSLRAQRPGTLRQLHGAAEYGAPVGVGLILKPGTQPEPVTFRLVPPAAISGRVAVTGGGSPDNVRVQLMRTAIVGGHRRAVVFRTYFTNDRGDFRFAHLPAGRYYLAADGRPWHQSVNPNPVAPKMFQRTYFPAATSAAGAAAIVLEEGGEFTANLSLAEVPTVPVRLRLSGEGLPQASYAVRAETVDGTPILLHNGTVYDGEAVLDSVSPGTYDLVVSGRKNGRSYHVAGRVELGRSAEPVTLEMSAIPKVSGEARCAVQPDAGESRGVIMLTGGQTGYAVPIAAGGRFEFDGVPPGKYVLSRIGGGPCYFHRATLGGKPLPDNLLPVGDVDLAGLILDMRSDAARLRGRALQAGKGVPGRRVMLLPASGPIGPFDARAYTSDSDGGFSFKNAPPGEYRLLSVASWDIEFANPKAMAPLLEKGVPVTLPPNGDVRVDLPLAPQP